MKKIIRKLIVIFLCILHALINFTLLLSWIKELKYQVENQNKHTGTKIKGVRYKVFDEVEFLWAGLKNDTPV